VWGRALAPAVDADQTRVTTVVVAPTPTRLATLLASISARLAMMPKAPRVHTLLMRRAITVVVAVGISAAEFAAGALGAAVRVRGSLLLASGACEWNAVLRHMAASTPRRTSQSCVTLSVVLAVAPVAVVFAGFSTLAAVVIAVGSAV